MRVAIAGLGLIGGSFAKAIKARTDHYVSGYDTDRAVAERALDDGAVDSCGAEFFSLCDMALVALYPSESADFILKTAPTMKRGAIIVDLCGVKRYLFSRLDGHISTSGVVFIGGHPMAGREASGYGASQDSLFHGASMILTPPHGTPEDKLLAAQSFFLSLGFSNITLTTPERHDEMIAFTSQLAHVVSSAYALCPLSENFNGFSAGSFGDMTRVAKLNEHMWAELFLLNSDMLTVQIDALMDNLEKYRSYIASRDCATLTKMLMDGRLAKERLEKRERAQ
ncbi:MAG: prephenate dehydrogenase [Oscillospiraceae bacterium]|jgi:prephenate dehydrogenase|nr:prephenate dehydrogenase [Oscillospiraceae bacterium]